MTISEKLKTVTAEEFGQRMAKVFNESKSSNAIFWVQQAFTDCEDDNGIFWNLFQETLDRLEKSS